MSNIKQVHIEGVMPFNITDDDEAAKWLGYLNGPSTGLRIKYGATHLIPLESGGKLTMYEFVIAGHEALSFKRVEAIVAAFEAAGASISVHSVIDIEDGWS